MSGSFEYIAILDLKIALIIFYVHTREVDMNNVNGPLIRIVIEFNNIIINMHNAHVESDLNFNAKILRFLVLYGATRRRDQ